MMNTSLQAAGGVIENENGNGNGADVGVQGSTKDGDVEMGDTPAASDVGTPLDSVAEQRGDAALLPVSSDPHAVTEETPMTFYWLEFGFGLRGGWPFYCWLVGCSTMVCISVFIRSGIEIVLQFMLYSVPVASLLCSQRVLGWTELRRRYTDLAPPPRAWLNRMSVIGLCCAIAWDVVQASAFLSFALTTDDVSFFGPFQPGPVADIYFSFYCLYWLYGVGITSYMSAMFVGWCLSLKRDTNTFIKHVASGNRSGARFVQENPAHVDSMSDFLLANLDRASYTKGIRSQRAASADNFVQSSSSGLHSAVHRPSATPSTNTSEPSSVAAASRPKISAATGTTTTTTTTRQTTRHRIADGAPPLSSFANESVTLTHANLTRTVPGTSFVSQEELSSLHEALRLFLEQGCRRFGPFIASVTFFSTTNILLHAVVFATGDVSASVLWTLIRTLIWLTLGMVMLSMAALVTKSMRGIHVRVEAVRAQEYHVLGEAWAGLGNYLESAERWNVFRLYGLEITPTLVGKLTLALLYAVLILLQTA